MDARRDVLGMCVGENESAKFWISIINGIKNRGVDDILLKMLYLETMDITKKWTGHRQDWRQIYPQLGSYFEERLSGRIL